MTQPPSRNDEQRDARGGKENTLREAARTHDEAQQASGKERFVTNPGGYENSLAATKDETPGTDPKGIARGD